MWEFEGIPAVWHPVREGRKQGVGIKRGQRKEVVMLGDGLNSIMIVSIGRLDCLWCFASCVV
jgi:hypothetical protein